MGYFVMQHSTQADYKALQINATLLQRIASQAQANSNQAQRNVGRIYSLSLSLSLDNATLNLKFIKNQAKLSLLGFANV